MKATRARLMERLDRGETPTFADLEQMDDPPSRSTYYAWLREWRTTRARDTSGPWSLATDETGQPEVVMRVLAALSNAAKTRAVSVTNAEARWLVRIGRAVPAVLEDPLRLRGEALRYVDAETAGDTEALADLDVRLALLYVTTT